MIALAPISVSFFSIWAILVVKSDESESFRIAFIKTSVVIGIYIVIVTEVLSGFQVFNYTWLVSLWTILALFSSTYLIATCKKRKLSFFFEHLQRILRAFKNLPLFGKVSIFVTSVIIFLCFFNAILAAPNNSDSLCYHLPRVAHWIQNRSVAHYPTHDLRQISFPPGAAFIVAHLNILSRSDLYANCVQLWAFLGSVISISLITKKIGGSRAQIGASLVCASIPMAVMQSTTTQTDLTVTFWLICFVFWVFKTNQYSMLDLIWLAMSFGLAVLAKPTAYLFRSPFLALFGHKFFREKCSIVGFPKRMVTACLKTLFILVLAIGISLPAYLRNYNVFGSFLGIDTGTRLQTISAGSFVSNVLRNIGLNLPILEYWKAVEIIHHDILGIRMDDPSTTFDGKGFQYNYRWLYLLPDEDLVGSPTHFMLFGFACLLFLLRGNRHGEYDLTDMRKFVLCLLAGFILYSLLLKWQIWGNRLMLPMVFIGSVASGVLLSRLQVKRSTSLHAVLVCCLSAVGIFYSLTPIRHPFISLPKSYSTYSQSDSVFTLTRQEKYFSGTYKDLNVPINAICQRIRRDKPKVIGLIFDEPLPEYLFWVSAINGSEPVKVMHVDVKNRSRMLAHKIY